MPNLGHAALKDRGVLADTELGAVSGGGFPTSFVATFLATVGGPAEARWTPRAYAVRTDLPGGLTGAP
jgi:hypothetical protein